MAGYPFTCVILGEGTLPVQCADILLQSGHQIVCLAAPDLPLQSWAHAHHIPFQSPFAQPGIPVFLERQQFDYLFSIINYFLLPEVTSQLPYWIARTPAPVAQKSQQTNHSTAVPPLSQTDYERIIRLPRRAAINYHDALLPRYAGFYVTSWAILNRETTHGVSWHRFTDQIDAGDLFAQQQVAIHPDDNALALNARCYEAAIQSFSRMVDNLASGRPVLTSQDMTRRTYYPLYRRLPAGGVISWTDSITQIDALLRALDFGPQPNPLGLPKIYTGSEFVYLSHARVTPGQPPDDPGAIIEAQPEKLSIAVRDGQLDIMGLKTLEGADIPLADFYRRFSINQHLPALDPHTATRLTSVYERLAPQETYWAERLASLQLPSIDLLPAGARASALTGRWPISIPSEVEALLNHQPGWRLSRILAAAFGLTLSRLGSNNTFDIGCSQASRLEDLTGMDALVAAWPPLRLEIDLLQASASHYQNTNDALDAHAWRMTYPRDLIPRRPTLSTSGIDWDNFAWPAALTFFSGPEPQTPPSGAHIVLAISDQDDLHSNAWCFDPQSVPVSVMQTIHQSFTALLTGIATNPELPAWQLPVLAPSQAQQILERWNATAVEYPTSRLLHHLFQAQAGLTPQAIAVQFEDQRLTYAELDQLSNRLANALLQHDTGAEAIIGVCMERSIELVIALLGVLKAGAAYIPMDPAYPQDRLAWMLRSSYAPLLLTQQRLLPRLAEFDMPAQVICLDPGNSILETGDAQSPEISLSPDSPAYVLYTSGSTGQPKGVVIPHRAITNHMHWMQSAYPIGPADAVLQKTPISFDASVWEFYAPLLTGGRLVLARPDGHTDSQYLASIIRTQQITILQVVPTLLRMLLDEPDFSGCTSLRRVFVGGEALLLSDVERFYSNHAAHLINLYGPTEVTIDSVVWDCEHPSDLEASEKTSVPIGRPVDNIRAYILDPHGLPVPAGVSGELCLTGTGLARGYLNQPALTADRFLPDPYNHQPGARLYRTGDLARYLLDGTIEFLGRRDQQVKLRGFRVELGEIEAVLKTHPAIRESVVLARQDGSSTRLIAYLTTTGSERPPISTLRDVAARKLPDYMIPAAFVFLNKLPLLPNGKLDRSALPRPPQDRPELAASFVAPQNPTQEIIARAWSETLELDQIGIHDNFFEVGGDSLLATRIAHKLQQVFQIRLPLKTFFEAPTIAQIANRIEDIILAEIEQMDDDQAQRLLEDQQPHANE